MANEELQSQIDKLQRELNDLKGLFYKDNFSDLEIFRKKIQFLNKSINLKNLPTSASGLVAGDLWNDTNTIKIV